MNAQRLEEIFLDCLFHPEEIDIGGQPIPPFKEVAGIVQSFGFHAERLKSHEAEVVAMFDTLPIEFLSKKDGGGDGWTFLQLCMTRDGHQWGEHRNCEQLVALALGLDHAWYPFGRDTWGSLPGGVPYIAFSKTKRVS